MGGGAMTEKETLQRPNSAAGGAGPREVLVDAHCHVWRTWPYEGPVPDPRTRGAVEQLIFEMDANDVSHAALVCASLPRNRNKSRVRRPLFSALPAPVLHFRRP